VIDVPETKYAGLTDDRIAYQVFGEGDTDLIYIPSTADCIHLRWQWPPYAKFLPRLGSPTRVMVFDLRGTGASDACSGDALPHWV